MIREQKGYSQAQIAEYLGTTRQTISNWEHDKTILDSRSLIRLADFYQISLDELCGRNAIPAYKGAGLRTMILTNACTLWSCLVSSRS
ncbi:hypothetical protein STRDD11_02213 [Streptococcus sp. DD11]|nr:hypothetical protein STRDD11_02213 [Streptococcus sp. DD11]